MIYFYPGHVKENMEEPNMEEKIMVGWLVGCFTVYQHFLGHLTPNQISNKSV